MTISMSVSVIIPVFNGADFLPEAVASLLDQNPRPREIIVVDDGSTDATAAVAQGLGAAVRYVRQDNRGPAAARNHGLRLADGDIIGFLDVDDTWKRGSMAVPLRILGETEGLGIVKGLTQMLQQIGKGGYRPVGRPFVFWNTGGTLYRREVFAIVGPFDEALRFSEDIDWFLRARENGVGIRIVDEVIQYHRRHGGNMTEGRTPGELNILRVVKASLDRRRAAGSSFRKRG